MQKSPAYNQLTSEMSKDCHANCERIISQAKESLSRPEFLECTGNMHFYRGEFQESVEFYEEAMEVQSDYDCARYHYMIGVQLAARGKLTEAFGRFQAAIEIEPTFADTYSELGAMLVKVQDFAGALVCYRDAERLGPDNLSTLSNIASVLEALKECDPSYSEEYALAVAKYRSVVGGSKSP